MINSVETFIIDVPTIRPHKLSVATMNAQAQALVLVRIRCADGIEGWGEATTIGGLNYGDESPESIKINIDTYFAPLIIGMKADQVAKVMHKLRTTIQGNRFAKCAIETALLDAQGKRLGVPISELLGGRVRNQLPVAWTLASGNTEKDIAEVEKMIGLRRHNIFKLKIGLRSVQADVDHVLAIKRALGTDISVRVDVNQAWSELNAVEGVAALQAGGIDLIEQPVKAMHKASMARLTNQFDVAIMADEALHGPSDALELANKFAADVFAVKINQSGGLFPALQVATIAELSGISLYGGTMLEGAVGTAASAHVFSTFHDLAFGTELFGPLLLTEEILVEPLVYKDFSLQVPTGPGLGIQLDIEKINYLKRQQGHSDQVDLITAQIGDSMLFHVRMNVNLPPDMPVAEATALKTKEKEIAQGLQSSGKWRHLWRIAGQYANISIFDVESVDELHTAISTLPLFPYMQIEVMPLCRHPSSVRGDDS